MYQRRCLGSLLDGSKGEGEYPSTNKGYKFIGSRGALEEKCNIDTVTQKCYWWAQKSFGLSQQQQKNFVTNFN